MKKVLALTGTQKDYGLLKPLLRALQSAANLQLIVTGTHLSPELGKTVEEIENDGFKIIRNIGILDKPNIADRIAKIVKEASYTIRREKPDLVIVLGDRYESLACAVAATTERVLICHIDGGEMTFGAMDEVFRHAITKMSHLHFASTEESARRIISMGENPDRVFNVGSLGVENAKNLVPLSVEEINKRLGIELEEHFYIVTYHPETLSENPVKGCKKLCKALRHVDEQIIITGSSSDLYGEDFNKHYKKLADKKNNVHYFSSLGLDLYLSLLRNSTALVGNSSSGILEAPSFSIPTVNIGSRQEGKIQGDSIINVDTDVDEILKGMDMAKAFRDAKVTFTNPYQGIKSSERIKEEILKFLSEKPSVIKAFYE